MRLSLPLPSSWPRRQVGDLLVVDVAPDVTLTVDAVRPLPLNPEAWSRAVLQWGIDPAQLAVLRATNERTEDGWSVAVFLSEVRAPEGTTRRLHVAYPFLQWGTFAMLASKNAGWFDAVVDDVKALLLRGRPDWVTDQPLTVAALWEGFDEGKA